MPNVDKQITHSEGCWRWHHECAVHRVQELQRELDTVLKSRAKWYGCWQYAQQERDEARQWARRMYGRLKTAGIVCETCGRVMEWHSMDGFLCPCCEPVTDGEPCPSG